MAIVKKVKATLAKRTHARAGRVAAGPPLPTSMKKPNLDPLSYTFWVYGRPGIGKSTLAASWKDIIMFSCERVSPGLVCYDYNAENGGVTSWNIFLAGAHQLKTTKHGFRVVGIDTAEALYQLCMNHVCEALHITHPQDMPYGKGWSEVRKEFTRGLRLLADQNLSLLFISHAKEVEITSISGSSFTRIQPNVPGAAYDIFKRITDFVFYVEYVTDKAGNNRRVLITAGDEIIDAKRAVDLPHFLPLLKGKGYQTIEAAIAGKPVGISDSDILPRRSGGDVGQRLIREVKKEGGTSGQNKKKKLLHRRNG